eukprot:Gb_23163 [translate_table: standard]
METEKDLVVTPNSILYYDVEMVSPMEEKESQDMDTLEKIETTKKKKKVELKKHKLDGILLPLSNTKASTSCRRRLSTHDDEYDEPKRSKKARKLDSHSTLGRAKKDVNMKEKNQTPRSQQRPRIEADKKHSKLKVLLEDEQLHECSFKPTICNVNNLVLGYAHCGMVVVTHWIAPPTTLRLLKALAEYLDYKIKMIGHSLGGVACLCTSPMSKRRWFMSSSRYSYINSFNSCGFIELDRQRFEPLTHLKLDYGHSNDGYRDRSPCSSMLYIGP